MSKERTQVKAEEIQQRRMQVEKLHIWGLSVAEIAKEVRVDERTVSRDIQTNRKERLAMLTDEQSGGASEWLRNELADYVAFMEEAKRSFCEQSRTFKSEAARSKALYFAVQIVNQKVDTIKSLMLSTHVLHAAGDSLRRYENEDD